MDDPSPEPCRRVVRTAAVLALAAGCAGPAQALETRLVASGFDQPLFVTAPPGDSRLFVVERGGRIRSIDRFGGAASDFLDLSGTVASAGEQGLLGMAFDPGFADAASPGYGRFFVNFVDRGTQDTVIASFRTIPGNADTVDMTSRVDVLRIDQPDGRTNHKAGWLGFRPGEGDNLYIGTGDGGGSYDPDDNAQNTASLLGKMLRIDVNNPDPGLNYGIPAGNPYAGATPGADEVWASGLRNPYRASFDRETGDLWIGDVGQETREEIDFEPADFAGGANYGWRLREGDVETPNVGGEEPAGYVAPVLDYGREHGITVIGGYVYRGSLVPELEGKYIFGDFGSGRIWAIDADGTPVDIDSAIELTAVLNPDGSELALSSLTSFGEDGFGELYLVDLDGRIIAVVPEPASWAMMSLGVLAIGAAVRRGAGRTAAPA